MNNERFQLFCKVCTKMYAADSAELAAKLMRDHQEEYHPSVHRTPNPDFQKFAGESPTMKQPGITKGL